MITTALIGLLYYVLLLITAPLRLLPNAVLPGFLEDGLAAVGGSLPILNDVFPVSSLIYVLGLVLALEGAIFSYKVIRWTYQKIPGIS